MIDNTCPLFGDDPSLLTPVPPVIIDDGANIPTVIPSPPTNSSQDLSNVPVPMLPLAVANPNTSTSSEVNVSKETVQEFIDPSSQQKQNPAPQQPHEHGNKPRASDTGNETNNQLPKGTRSSKKSVPGEKLKQKTLNPRSKEGTTTLSEPSRASVQGRKLTGRANPKKSSPDVEEARHKSSASVHSNQPTPAEHSQHDDDHPAGEPYDKCSI